MSDNMSMEELMSEYKDVDDLRAGDVVEGKVLSVTDDEVIVNINYMSDGIIPKEEIENANTSPFSEGDTVKVYVMKVNDGEGNVLLSLRKAEGIMVWDELAGYMANNTHFTVKIKEAVKGGVVADYKTARIFIPGSHLSAQYVENLSDYVGQQLEVVLIEYDQEKKKVVASRKVIEQAELERKRQDMMTQLSVGDQLSGKVVSLAKYGAFVDLGGVDGLIHISQMSWRRVKHPSEVVTVGDVVDVIVTNIDREKERIGLKLANVQENPWDHVEENYHVDDIVWGTVVRVTTFGAFVALEEGLEGLVHISELSTEHVGSPQEVVSEGDEIEVMILSINQEEKRLSLSRKAVVEVDEESYEPYEEEEASASTLSDLFGDKLKNLKF